MRRLLLAVLGAVLLAVPVPANAAYMFGFSPFGTQTLSVTTTTGVFDINAFDTGWYRNDGLHQIDNTNYIACEGNDCGSGSPSTSDFFAFRLGTITGDFVSATLSIGNGPNGYVGPATSPLSLWDFGGDINSLLGGTAGVAGYTDLRSGTLYGSGLVSAADNSTQVLFNLNAAALAAIQAGLNSNGGSGLLVIGGSLTAAQVPEPVSLALLGMGLSALGLIRRRSLTRH